MSACPQFPSLHVYGILKKAILTALLSLTHLPLLQSASYCFCQSPLLFANPGTVSIFDLVHMSLIPQNECSCSHSHHLDRRCSIVVISHKYQYVSHLTDTHLTLLETMGTFPGRNFVSFSFSITVFLIATPSPRTHRFHPVPNLLGHPFIMVHKGFPLRPGHIVLLCFSSEMKLVPRGFAFCSIHFPEV